MKKNPFPTVTFKGTTYKLKRRNIEVPELEKMKELEALVWLNKNTWAKCYQKEPNPLIGLAGAVTIK